MTYVMYGQRGSQRYECRGTWRVGQSLTSERYDSLGRRHARGPCPVCGREISIQVDGYPYRHATNNEDFAWSDRYGVTDDPR